MRGKAPINRHQAEEHGVTPACAGKSAGTGSRSGASWDHPRVCGEKADWTNSDVVEWGSPPRVRGKVSVRAAWRPYHGITPAYAGKSKTSAVGCPGCRDHPRVCGEKTRPSSVLVADLGSPPHVRGKGLEKLAHERRRGITPACAGKRKRPKRWVRPPKDHPRVCGEKAAICTAYGKVLGSPPRVRGKAGRQLGIGGLVGITPACAGKSST